MEAQDTRILQKEMGQLEAFMNGRFVCPSCKARLSLAGLAPLKMAKCPSCSALNAIPQKIQSFWIFYPLEIGDEKNTLYKAYHESYPRRLFTVKILPRDRKDDVQLIEKLKQEADLISVLGDHPCILKEFEHGEEDGEYFLATEFIQGERLDLYVRRQDKLPDSEAILIILRLLSGAAAICENGYFFRDFGPKNVMINNPNGAYLGSFKNCTLAGERIAVTDDTGVDDRHFMSPEQILNREETVSSEIFSLGLLFYYMLVGKPFFFDHEMERFHVVFPNKNFIETNGEQRLGQVSPEILVVLRRMITFVSEDRYRRYFDVEHDLTRILWRKISGEKEPAPDSESELEDTVNNDGK